MLNDYVFEGRRKQLVSILKKKGIKDQNVLDAILLVPRHLFIESGIAERAYENNPLPILANQTISQPYTVAFQTELLDIKKGEKILEVGTGCGYQSAVIITLGGVLYTMERIQELYKFSAQVFLNTGYMPRKHVYGDGYQGLPNHAPFDKIIVTAGASTIPKELLRQLKEGGKLVIPVGKNEQIMTLITRQKNNNFIKKEYGLFKFVPMLSGRG